MLKSILLTALFLATASLSLAAPLHEAIWRGDVKKIKQLIKESTWKQLIELDDEGNTPLHVAAAMNQPEILNLLLFEGGQQYAQMLHAQNRRGEQVLDTATRAGSWQVIDFLYRRALGLADVMPEEALRFDWAERLQIARALGGATLGMEGDWVGVMQQSWPIPVQHERALRERLDAHAQRVGVFLSESYQLTIEQLRFLEIIDADLGALIRALKEPTLEQTPWQFILHRILRQIYDQFILMAEKNPDHNYIENPLVRQLKVRLSKLRPLFFQRVYSQQHLYFSDTQFPISVVNLMIDFTRSLKRADSRLDIETLEAFRERLQAQFRFYRSLVPIEYILQSAQNLAARTSTEALDDMELKMVLSELGHIAVHVGGVRNRIPGMEHGLRRFSEGQLKAIRDAGMRNAHEGDFELLRQGFYATIPWEFFARLGKILHAKRDAVQSALTRTSILELMQRISGLVEPLRRLVDFESTPRAQAPGIPADQFTWNDAVWKQADLDAILKIIKTLKQLESIDEHTPRSRQIYALVRFLEILGESDKNISPGLKAKYAARWAEVFQGAKDIRDFFSHLEQGNNLHRWRTFEASNHMDRFLAEFLNKGLSSFTQFFRAIYGALLKDEQLPKIQVEFKFILEMVAHLTPRISVEDRQRLKKTVPKLSRMAIALIWQIESNQLSFSLNELLSWINHFPLSKEEKRTLWHHLSKLETQKLNEQEQAECLRILNSVEAQNEIWVSGHGPKQSRLIDNIINGLASLEAEQESALRPARELGVTNLEPWEELYADLHTSARVMPKKYGQESEAAELRKVIAVAKKILDELKDLGSILPDEFKRMAQETNFTAERINRLREILESNGPAWLASEHLVSSFRAFAVKLARHLNDWSGGFGAPSEKLNDHFEQFAAELNHIEHFAKSYLHIHDVTEIAQPNQRLIFIILRLLYGDILLGQGKTLGVLQPYPIKSTKTYLEQFVHATTDAVRKVESHEPEQDLSLPSVASTAAAVTISSSARQIQNYWYNEDDLQQALELRLQERMDINRPDLRVLPAIGGTHLGQQIETFLGQELARDRMTPRTILLPYNIDNQHWIGIVVQYGPQVVIEILDSFGAGGRIPDYVWRELRAVFPGAEIRTPQVLEQRDSYNCGPLTVENLVRATTRALGLFEEVHHRDGAMVRIHQLGLLRQAGYEIERLIVPMPSHLLSSSQLYRVSTAQAFFKK